MSAELLQALARYVAARQWAEGGRDAVILDRLKSSADRLSSLFQEWKLDFERQEQMLCECLGFDRRREALPPSFTPVLPERPQALREFLAKKPALLLRTGTGRAVLGTSDPLLVASRDQFAVLLGVPVDVVWLSPEELARGREMLRPALESIAPHEEEAGPQAAEQYTEESGPVVQLVDLTIQEAIQRKASDIHVEPFERHGVVRYRVDGVLMKGREYAHELHSAITSRMKLMAGMDIAERRIPQDGRIRYDAHGADVDIRVASIPSAHGEAIIMRILSRSSVKVDLGKGGFRPELLTQFRRSFGAAQGIILVTGPTGSGKTTTLYGVLNELNQEDTKIFTIEDPIEYQLEGIVQVPVNAKVGLTFAAGLRAFLRGDPDIIMVGEIRDQETAEIAIKAALTGHLVLATVHTNSAPATLTRLIDMGVEPYNLSATIQAILAQRLCRRVCKSCVRPARPSEAVADLFRANGVPVPETIVETVGCDACNRMGYAGRLGVHEFLQMNEPLRLAVNRSASDQELAALAGQHGMTSLMQDGLLKVAAGQTTMPEILRVLGGTLESVADAG